MSNRRKGLLIIGAFLVMLSMSVIYPTLSMDYTGRALVAEVINRQLEIKGGVEKSLVEGKDVISEDVTEYETYVRKINADGVMFFM